MAVLVLDDCGAVLHFALKTWLPGCSKRRLFQSMGCPAPRHLSALLVQARHNKSTFSINFIDIIYTTNPSVLKSFRGRQIGKLSIMTSSHHVSCHPLICCRPSQSQCLLLRPRPRRPRSPLPHDPPSPMLSPANTPSIYTSEYVSPLHKHQISFVKSTLWPLRGYSGRKTNQLGFGAGTRCSFQEESTKGYQRDSGFCDKCDGTWNISISP